jgi:hypothetical protein
MTKANLEINIWNLDVLGQIQKGGDWLKCLKVINAAL